MTRSMLAPLSDAPLTRAEKDAIVAAVNAHRADLDRAEETIDRLQADLRAAQAEIAALEAEIAEGHHLADAAEAEAIWHREVAA